MEYEEMLKKARKELPEKVFKTERFEIPKAVGHHEGNKTIITNFKSIADVINRDVNQLMKWLLKELATPGELRRNILILGSKIPLNKINEKIQKYIKEFVICKECKRPDTRIVKEEGFYFLRCEACGAKYPLKI